MYFSVSDLTELCLTVFLSSVLSILSLLSCVLSPFFSTFSTRRCILSDLSSLLSLEVSIISSLACRLLSPMISSRLLSMRLVSPTISSRLLVLLSVMSSTLVSETRRSLWVNWSMAARSSLYRRYNKYLIVRLDKCILCIYYCCYQSTWMTIHSWHSTDNGSF